jgi:hypothetical protein
MIDLVQEIIVGENQHSRAIPSSENLSGTHTQFAQGSEFFVRYFGALFSIFFELT